MIQKCPECGTELGPGTFANHVEAARCGRCGTLVDLRVGKKVSRFPAIAYPKPERWRVEDGFGGLRLSWRSLSFEVLPLTLFALFWNGIMLAMAVEVSQGLRHPLKLLYGLAIPHVWAGLWVAYYCVGRWVNSVRIEAAAGELSVRIGPLPWVGQRHYASREVTQLFVVERLRRGTPYYELCAVLRDGKRQTVVRRLKREEEARFLESRLEKALGIEDRSVEGELRRLG